MASGRVAARAGTLVTRRPRPQRSLAALVERRRARALARQVAWLEARGRPQKLVAPARRPVPRQRWF